MGNLTSEYVTLLQESLGGLPCHLFTWSSANHHLARVVGCCELILDLANRKRQNDHLRHILLIGHSHAGQLFALLSDILSQGPLAHLLINQTAEIDLGIPVEEVMNAAELIRDMKIDVVSWGTPPRYQWHPLKNMRVMHMVNHRGDEILAGQVSGLLFTRDGDYIQQWGGEGSDAIAPIEKDRRANSRLNEVLGPGADIPHWLTHVQKRKRLPAYGFTYLIDYQDAQLHPNCLATLFGHGIYSRYQAMGFNFSLIGQHFYS